MNQSSQLLKFFISQRIPSIKFLGPRANIIHTTQKMSTSTSSSPVVNVAHKLS